MDIEKEELNYKIFLFGIYGENVTKLTEKELKKIIFEPYIELIHESQHANLQKQFVSQSLAQEKEKILRDNNLTTQTIKTLSLLSLLSEYYIRMNLYTFRTNLVGNAFFFQKPTYFTLFDKMLKCFDFMDFVDIKKHLGISISGYDSFMRKMIDNNIFEFRMVDNKRMVRLKRENNRVPVFKKKSELEKIKEFTIKVYTEEEKEEIRNNIEIAYNVPFYEQIKELISKNKAGISSVDLTRNFKVTQKHALNILKKMQLLDTAINCQDVAEGKITRLVFFYNTAVDEKKDEQERVLIVRSEKMEIIREIIKESGPVLVNKSLCIEFAERLKSKFIPDTKNLAKIAIEAGLNVHRIDIGKDRVNLKKVICQPEVGYNDILRMGFSQIEENTLNDSFKVSIYKFFVSYRKFIEIDNGYLYKKADRIAFFYSFIDKTENFIVDNEFMLKMKIEDLFKIIPYHFYLKESNKNLNVCGVKFDNIKYVENMSTLNNPDNLGVCGNKSNDDTEVKEKKNNTRKVKSKKTNNKKASTNKKKKNNVKQAINIDENKNNYYLKDGVLDLNKEVNAVFEKDNTDADKNIKSFIDEKMELLNIKNETATISTVQNDDELKNLSDNSTAKTHIVENILQPKAGEILIDTKLTVKEIIDRKYINLRTSIIKTFFSPLVFSNLIATMESYGIIKAERGDSYFKLTKKIPLNEVLKTIGHKQKKTYYIPLNERLKFYEKIKDFDKKEFYEKVKNLLESEYDGEEYLALRQRLDSLFPFPNAQSHVGKPNNSRKMKEKVSPLYREIKRKIILSNCIDIDKLGNYNTESIKKVLETLKKENIINYNPANKTIFLRSRAQSILNLENIKTTISDRYYYRNKESIVCEDEYLTIFMKIIFYLIVSNGTLSFEALIDKVGILRDCELNECLDKLDGFVSLNTIDDITYISLKENNV